MARYRPDAELDARLDRIKSCTEMYLCSSQPTTRAGAISASLGSYTLAGGDYSANADYTGADGGRYTTVSAKSGNNASASGTGTHLALCTSTELREVLVLSSSVTTTSGQPFSVSSFQIIEQDPAAPA